MRTEWRWFGVAGVVSADGRRPHSVAAAAPIVAASGFLRSLSLPFPHPRSLLFAVAPRAYAVTTITTAIPPLSFPPAAFAQSHGGHLHHGRDLDGQKAVVTAARVHNGALWCVGLADSNDRVVASEITRKPGRCASCCCQDGRHRRPAQCRRRLRQSGAADSARESALRAEGGPGGGRADACLPRW